MKGKKYQNILPSQQLYILFRFQFFFTWKAKSIWLEGFFFRDDSTESELGQFSIFGFWSKSESAESRSADWPRPWGRGGWWRPRWPLTRESWSKIGKNRLKTKSEKNYLKKTRTVKMRNRMSFVLQGLIVRREMITNVWSNLAQHENWAIGLNQNFGGIQRQTQGMKKLAEVEVRI